MLNTTRQNHNLWDALIWWLTALLAQPAPPRQYAPVTVPMAQPTIEYVDIGRKFPIPADKLDYYYTAAD